MNKYFLVIAGVSFIQIITSCNTDISNEIGPSIGFENESGYITNDVTLDEGSEIKVRIKAFKGSSELKEFAIYQKSSNQIQESLVRPELLIVDNKPSIGNPSFVNDLNDKTSFVKNIYFSSSKYADTIIYTFEVTDINRINSRIQFLVITKDVITDLIAGAKLFNREGSPGRGGIDLQTGTSTGSLTSDSTSATAELFDLGNNITTGTYAARFAPANPETSIKATLDTWDSFITSKNIEEAYNTGNNVGTVITAIPNSIYTIKNGKLYFAIKINKIVDTPNSNDDYIEMDIKL